MHRSLKVIFQNKQNQNTICNFTNLNIRNTVLIPGSGVDLDKFKFKASKWQTHCLIPSKNYCKQEYL